MNIYGCPYPIEKTPMGYLGTQTGIDQIKSDLLVLLLTNPGERVMLPEFGTPLRKLVFEQNDATLRMQARAMAISAIERWEPRIVVNAIDVMGSDPDSLNAEDTLEDLDYILTIKIEFFDPYNIKNVEVLTLELPLASAPDASVTKPLAKARNQGEEL